jgi:hypothetical protein
MFEIVTSKPPQIPDTIIISTIISMLIHPLLHGGAGLQYGKA